MANTYKVSMEKVGKAKTVKVQAEDIFAAEMAAMHKHKGWYATGAVMVPVELVAARSVSVGNVLLSGAATCFLLAGLFHVFLRADVTYPNDHTAKHNPDPHIACIWKATNTVAVQF